jgi:hypothetical protein
MHAKDCEMRNHDKNWENIRSKAESNDVFDRLAALTRSVFFLELALIATGPAELSFAGEIRTIQKAPRRQGVCRLLQNSKLAKELDPSFINSIKNAIQARNIAVHQGKTPDPEDCAKMVDDLFSAWIWMRRQFVTRRTAADLAKNILKSDIFYKVFLFGSLSRNKPDPVDMDLLIFDNGEISYIGDRYGELRNLTNRAILEKAGIEDKAIFAALDSDWIDMVVVHYEHFVNDPDYIRNIASTQSPFFLLNISDRIQVYDERGDKWLSYKDLPFEKWEAIRNELETEGIVFCQ